MEIRKVDSCETVIHADDTLHQDKAYEPSQKYKEGKYILERNLLVDVQ